MGVVHEARDLELDRVVAVKQIRHRRAKSTRARARLRREAAAMAQLSHPNVVRIFDVVEDDGGIFVIMEFVDGDTLDVHLMRAGVDWRTLVPLFVAIGRGLAAIHARGLVHRDFKPANVLIGEDGTPRVTDFGLVQFPGDSSSANPSSADEEEEVRDLLSPLTAPGMVAGTPKYMPPEQQQGKPVDEKADQYAFCLTFWEALAGFVPFRETDATRLLDAKNAGVPTSERPPAPAAVVDVLRRGLDPEPTQRWPSMRHLLDALEKTQRTRTPLWWFVPPLAIGAAMLAVVLQDEGTGCGDPDEALADVWGGPEREGLAAALQGARPRITATTEAKLLDAMDGWAGEWLSAYSEACDAATGAERDAVLACLRRRRAQLGGTVEVLTTDDPGVLTRGLEMLAGLPRVDSCRDVTSEQTEADDGRTAVVERAVARAEAFGHAGQHAEALDAVDGVLANLSCSDFPQHCVRLRMVMGLAYVGVTRFEDSSRAYEEAYAAALRAGDDRAATSAALALAFNESTYTADFTAARRWLEHAESLTGRVEGDTASLRASVLSTKARLDVLTNHVNDGLANAEAAVDACLEQGRGDTACTHSLGTLAWAVSYVGQHERAEMIQRRTLAALIEEVGADHHRTALQYGGLARTLEHLGQDEEVLPLTKKEYEIYARVHGEAHPRTATAKIMVAKHLVDRENVAEAREIIDEVMELCERHRELPDYVRATALTTGAYLDSSVGRHRDARKQTVRVLEITASIVGADHPANGPQHSMLAGEERELGRYELAEKELERAKALLRDPMYRANLYRDWVRLKLDQGQVEDADAMLARAEAAWAEREFLDPQVAAQRANLLGQVALARGEAAAAREHFRDAMQLCAAGTLPHPSLRLEYALGFARAAVDLDDDAAALEVLEEAKAWATDQRPPQQVAEYEFVLARALWSSRRADAKRHLARAQETIQTAEGGYALRAEITMWAP